MAWPWNRTTAAPPAAAEAASYPMPADGLHIRCAACHHPMPTVLIELQEVPGIDGTVFMCADETACRERAQAVGIYGAVA